MFFGPSMNDSSIRCESGQFQGNISTTVPAPVVVFIDNAVVMEGEVQFAHLDVVAQPMFIYTDTAISSPQVKTYSSLLKCFEWYINVHAGRTMHC